MDSIDITFEKLAWFHEILSQRLGRVHKNPWGLHNELIFKNTVQFIADHYTDTVEPKKGHSRNKEGEQRRAGSQRACSRTPRPLSDIRVSVTFSASQHSSPKL